MCTIMTTQILKCDLDDEPPHDPDADDEGWPPFKKVGAFDPLLDDTRFVILKLALCPITQLLIVGGAGGQVIFYNLAKEGIEAPEVIIHFLPIPFMKTMPLLQRHIKSFWQVKSSLVIFELSPGFLLN